MIKTSPASRKKPVVPAPPRRRKVNVATETIVADGVVEVHRSMYGAEHHRLEKVSVPHFSEEPGRVMVEGSVTRNLGDFNSVRVTVAVSLPCYPVASEIDRAKAFASEKVDQYIQDELAVATAATGGA